MKHVEIVILLAAIPGVDLAAQSSNSLAPPSIEVLVSQASNGQEEAILELGRRGDPGLIPVLSSLCEPRYSPRIAESAQAARAKLGDESAFIAVARDLSSTDAQAQDEAIRSLTYIADDRATIALAQLLSDSNWRKEPKQNNSAAPEMDKVFHEPLQVLAIRALSQLVPNPPSPKTDRPGEAEIAKWQAWWGVNRTKFDGSTNVDKAVESGHTAGDRGESAGTGRSNLKR